MSNYSRPILVLLAALIFFPVVASAQETTLKSGQSFVMRIAGVPADEVALVSQKYGISDAGTVRLPYLKAGLKAAGLKPSILAKKIEEAYRKAEIYTRPTIQVDVSGIGQQERFVSVLGEVKAPRQVSYIPQITILDAIAQCSGFTDFAYTKEVKLTRRGKVTYHRLSGSDPKQNVRLEPGDIVTVRSGRRR